MPVNQVLEPQWRLGVRQGWRLRLLFSCHAQYVQDVYVQRAMQVVQGLSGLVLEEEVQPRLLAVQVVVLAGGVCMVRSGSGWDERRKARTPCPQPSEYSPPEPCFDLTAINSAISLCFYN